ncbi:DNA-processing protein DprA [Wenyingzhuangia sp. IMCC45533]
MNTKEIQYALSLQFIKGVGSVTAKSLINIYGSATALFQSHQVGVLKPNVNVTVFRKIFTQESLDQAQRELSISIAKGLKCLYFKDKNYPSYLLNCADAPVIIFHDGGDVINHHKKILSIVGTRNMTSYGRDFCNDLITSLKEYQPLIVSGFAFGVDICAHTLALKHELPTLAVLAHGFGTLYPKEHKKYYQDIKESGGFLSEFGYDEPPYKENFLKRNRIVAGMSQATIIVESAKKGGALVTADIANSYNKDVFAVPGKTTDLYSKGCNALIKQHKAALITSGEDLVLELGWEKNKKTEVSVQPQLFVDLVGDEKLVYDALEQTQLYVDEISRIVNLPIYKISNCIFQLEMKGLIHVLPGKLIKRT